MRLEERALGVDIVGLNPKNEKGEYFRSNWWYWRKLWYLVVKLCKDILGPAKLELEDGTVIEYHEAEAGCTNDGLVIPAEKAEEMGRRLMKVVEDDEEWEKWSKIVNEEFDAMDREVWEQMKKALGLEEEWEPAYKLDRDVARRFAEFCLNCGGFAVY